MGLRIVMLVALILSFAYPVRAQQSIGEAVKKVFSTPTPPPGRKKKKTSSKKETSSPSPSATLKKSSPSPESSPRSHAKESSVKAEKSPSPSESIAGKSKKKKSGSSPTPAETPSETPGEPTQSPTSPVESPPADTTSRSHKKNGAPNASLTPDAIKGFEDNPPQVKKLLESALGLTTRNLDYKYGSADPGNGGMDCSGFVYYVLKENGIADTPRDSSQQYVWLRRMGRFEAVASRKDDSFELENLKPGDLLFWTGTYSIERDPPITHSMIYLGREKDTGARVMVGSSDGRVYHGQSRNGVSVFDFRVERRNNGEDGKTRPAFIGYGHIPGIRDR